MGFDLRSQFSAGIDQAMTVLGSQATYTQPGSKSSITLPVILCEPNFLTMTGDGPVIIALDNWDILVRAADLVFSGTVYEPRVGDIITIGAVTYALQLADGNRNCWTWNDKYMIRRRLKTKITSA